MAHSKNRDPSPSLWEGRSCAIPVSPEGTRQALAYLAHEVAPALRDHDRPELAHRLDEVVAHGSLLLLSQLNTLEKREVLDTVESLLSSGSRRPGPSTVVTLMATLGLPSPESILGGPRSAVLPHR